MAVFLVIGCLLTGAWFLRKTGFIEEKGILGGPGSSPFLSSAEGAEPGQPSAMLGTSGEGALVGPGGQATGYPGLALSDASLSDGAAIRDAGMSVGPAFDRSGMISYVVQSGDNLSRIASYFGISVDTIVSANPGVKANALKIGQTLNILPTSGVVYRTRGDDTLESISSQFGVSQDKITQFNRSLNFASLDPGVSVIIPGGKSANLLAGAAALPNFNGEFIMPTNGYDWGILHHYNAVDIANSCGTPVVAAAEGLVVPDDSIPGTVGDWNEGYGNFVLIEHPFGDGVRTRYAHLEKISAQIGGYVKQGQAIGLMGETGDATGCHVHFEVYGAQNPFARQ